MKNYKMKKAAGRLIAAVMILMLLVSMNTSMLAMSYGAEKKSAVLQDTDVSGEDIRKSIDNVIAATDRLKELMKPEDQSAIMEIFGGFVSFVGTANMALSFINGSTSFLKLIGVMKDANAEALANISRQLVNIDEKLTQMDVKLDKIRQQMTEMQAKGDFEARAIKANQMLEAWRDFKHDYMTVQMDELMNDYETKMLNSTRAWIENKKEGARTTEADGLSTSKVIVLYSATPKKDGLGPLDFEYYPHQAAANYIEPDMDRPKDFSDRYTIYANDDEFNPRFDKYAILGDWFLPQQGDIQWNVNNYRESLVKFVKAKLISVRDSAAAGDTAAVKESGIILGRIDLASYTDEQVAELAEDAVNALLYRISYVMVNESADFAKDVYKEFGDFSNEVQSGTDAMLKAMYLTHAFEYEISDDIQSFCDEMLLRAGVYSMFAANIAGMSEYLTDEQKVNVAASMCESIDSIQGLLNNAFTGEGRYCYVTGSVLSYGEVTFSGNAMMKYHIRGAMSGYDSYSADPVKKAFKYNDAVSSGDPALIGDSNALVISYYLKSAGNSLTHDYMAEHFNGKGIQKRSALLTTINPEETLTAGTNLKLKTHKIIGGYFYGDPEIYPNNLPKKAEQEYLVHRRMITGTTFNGDTLAMNQSAPLFGIAAYGESHFMWEVDEMALMGGPCTDSTYKEEFSTKKVENGLFTDDWEAYYKNSMTYNCLFSVPQKLVGVTPGPYPLEELKELRFDGKLKQDLKVSKKPVTVKAKALKKKAKTVKAVTVKGAYGDVTYKKVSVNKKSAKFTVNKKTGKITLKKGLPKGTYKVKIKVSAGETKEYLPAEKNVTVTVKVK